jgi:hypothetical protein
LIHWIDREACTLEGHDAEQGFAVLRPKNNLGDRDFLHEFDASKADGELHALAIGELVRPGTLRFYPGPPQDGRG